jgi:hypothetical protein
MKNLLFSLILIFNLFIISCDLQYGICDEDNIKIGNIYDYSFPGSEEIPEFQTIEEAATWMARNSVYVSDNGDYWQTPEETFYRRNENNKMMGDCEDKAIFLCYLANKLNLDSSVVTTKNHAVTKVENWYYGFSDYSYNKYISLNDKIIYTIPFSEIIWMTVNYHDSVGKYR